MKLFRFGNPGDEKPGIELSGGRKIDISAVGDYYNDTLFEDGDLHWLQAWVDENAHKCPEIPRDSRIGPCVAKPSKIICVGLNYSKHAAESGMELPKEPVLFFKSTTALCGPYDNLVIPKDSIKTDWEVELAVIISEKASYVSEKDAMDYVGGYALHNDYSEREFQLERGGQWVKGKSADTFAPLGPYLVSKDEIPDPHNLRLWLDVNGTRMQDSSTADLIFKIPFLVSYISRFMTLLPDDVISTGTPPGVGLGQKPPRYIKPGDVITLGIEGLGEQKQIAKAYPG